SHQEMSGANASPIERSRQEMSGANASPIGRSHQEMSGANASPIGRSRQGMSGVMRLIASVLLSALTSSFAVAQRPSDPAVLRPQNAPELDYVVAPEPFSLPAGTTLAGAAAAVAFDSKGHLFVLTRGNPSLYEFDNNGKFIRSFGDGLFTRSHGLRIDKEGNIWATDVGA